MTLTSPTGEHVRPSSSFHTCAQIGKTESRECIRAYNKTPAQYSPYAYPITNQTPTPIISVPAMRFISRTLLLCRNRCDSDRPPTA